MECVRKAKSFNSPWKRESTRAINAFVLSIAPAKPFCRLLRMTGPKAQAILGLAGMPGCDIHHYFTAYPRGKLPAFREFPGKLIPVISIERWPERMSQSLVPTACCCDGSNEKQRSSMSACGDTNWMRLRFFRLLFQKCHENKKVMS
jgi:hypothetical protein